MATGLLIVATKVAVPELVEHESTATWLRPETAIRWVLYQPVGAVERAMADHGSGFLNGYESV